MNIFSYIYSKILNTENNICDLIKDEYLRNLLFSKIFCKFAVNKNNIMKLKKFQNNEVVFHKRNVKNNPAFYLDSVCQFFDDFKQPTENRIRKALLWKHYDPNCDTEYSIKAGGGSASDNLFESIIKVDGVAVLKKYSIKFDSVLINKEELNSYIQPLIPKENVISDHIYKLVMLTKDYMAGKIQNEVNWNESFQSSYLSQSELIKKYKENVRKAYQRKVNDKATSVEEYKTKFKILDNETDEDIKKKVDQDKKTLEVWEKILNFAENIEKKKLL